MNYLSSLISGPFIDALGWTLVHSIWQGALIASLVAIIMIMLRKGSAKSRYLVYFSSLILILGISVVTFIKVYDPADASGKIATVQSVESINEDLLLAAHENSFTEESQFDKAKKAFAGYFERNFPLFVSLWFLGICFFLLKFLGGYAYSQRLKHYRTLEATKYWNRKVLILSHKIGLNKSIRLAESALIKVPMVVGYLKPVILVPLGMLSSMPPQQVEAILTHELAHIYRKDYLFNLIQSVIDILFFYHPAIWWISRNIRMEREHICDDLVIMVNQDSIEYARALASVQEMKSNFPVPAPALARNKYELLNRIHRMMNKPRIIPSFTEGFMSALIILAGIIGMSATAAISFGSEELPQFGNDPQENIAWIDVAEPTGIRASEPIQVKPITITGIKSAVTALAPDTITDDEPDSLMKVVQQEMQKAMVEMEAAMKAKEAAMQQYQQAIQHQYKAQQEIMEKAGIKNYWVDVNRFRNPYVKHGYYFSDEHHDAWEELHEGLEELEELEMLKELEELDVWEEMEELEEPMELLEQWHIEMPSMPEMPQFQYHYNYDYDFDRDFDHQYEYTYPRNVWSHHYSDKTQSVILKELRRDGLIGWEGDQVIEIDSKGLYINGEKQSREAYKKYKRLYESLGNEEISADNSYKLIL